MLKKLLNGKIRNIARKNLVKSKKFSEMLNNSLVKYRNQAITNTEVIEELIKLAKEFDIAKYEGISLGLSEEEEAFYDALCVSDSAVKIMGDAILKQIAHDLAEAIRNNLTVDWNLKESVRARMRVIIKKLLKKYNYPPDQQEEAVKTVMEQAELLCREDE
jgi:type I restriction enzyme R subunit